MANNEIEQKLENENLDFLEEEVEPETPKKVEKQSFLETKMFDLNSIKKILIISSILIIIGIILYGTLKNKKSNLSKSELIETKVDSSNKNAFAPKADHPTIPQSSNSIIIKTTEISEKENNTSALKNLNKEQEQPIAPHQDPALTENLNNQYKKQ